MVNQTLKGGVSQPQQKKKTTEQYLKQNLQREFGGDAASRHAQLSYLRRQMEIAKKNGNHRRAKGLQNQINFFKNQYSPVGGKVTQLTDPESIEIPQVNVNADGTLQLPMDPSFSQAMKDMLAESQEALLSIKTESDEQSQQYTAAQRELVNQYDQARFQTKSQNAAKGTLFSSAYGTQLSDVSQQYAKGQSDLDLANTKFQQQTAAQRAAIQAALNRSLSDATFGYVTGNLSENAGQLGYGGKLAKASQEAQMRRRQMQSRLKAAQRAGNQSQTKYYQQQLQQIRQMYPGA